MKRITYLAFGLICLLVLPPSVPAQSYTGVWDVYYQSIAYPESFDQFVANNQSHFDSRFYSCLNALEQDWRPKAEEEIKVCNAFLDPHMKAICISRYQYVTFLNWSACLRALLTGQYHHWADTALGGVILNSKSMSMSIAPNLWVSAIDQSIPIVSAYFLCYQSQ